MRSFQVLHLGSLVVAVLAANDASTLLQAHMHVEDEHKYYPPTEPTKNGGPDAPVHSAVMDGGPLDLVNVLAGTSASEAYDISDGNTLPQIKMPWGFNDWAPQSSDGDRWWFFHGKSNYSRQRQSFMGMRCTHQPSPWIGDYGHFLLQVRTTKEKRFPEPDTWRYSLDDAVFRPYLFNATLFDESGSRIRFEFVPTSHAAVARITFPASVQTGHVVLSLGSGQTPSLLQSGEGRIEGRATENSGGVPNKWKGMYFTVKPLTGAQFKSQGSQRGPTTGHLPKSQELLFRTDQGPVVIALATSFISQEQADLNLEQQVGSRSFDQVLAEGRDKWAQQFKRVRIDAVDEMQQRTFYTNLWKSMLFPRYLQEVNAEGREVHRSPYTGKVTEGKLVADSGFWDSWNTVYSLQSLFFTDNLGGLIDGWVKAYKEARWLPQWASPGPHDCMVGTFGDVPLADAIVKSKLGFVTGFDVNDAYDAIRKDAFERTTLAEYSPNRKVGRTGLSEYNERGYVPDQAALTLGYYVSDAAIAHAAEALGKHEDAQVLTNRSKQYHRLFNKERKFFEPKDAQNRFRQDFDPTWWGNSFTEGIAWHYRFFVPHDVEGLNKLYDGKLCEAVQDMIQKRDGPAYGFMKHDAASHEMMEGQRDFKEFGLYGHGNQPVHHILYVAKKAGCNAIADEYLRKVMQRLYTVDGWPGDEDNGEMSSWYVLSALGVYMLEGGKDQVVLGSPAVKHATLELPNKKLLTIATQNQALNHVHVQSVTWTPHGGKARGIANNLLQYTELMRGGELKFAMGPLPKHNAQDDVLNVGGLVEDGS